jgi:hypothetical protein
VAESNVHPVQGDVIIDVYRNFSERMVDGGIIEIAYHGLTVFSYPGPRPLQPPLTEEQLDTVAPLRCPGLMNVLKNSDHSYTCPDTCSVCRAEYSEKQLTRTLPCNHSFHAACVDAWLLTRSPTCPICRADVRAVAIPPQPFGEIIRDIPIILRD